MVTHCLFLIIITVSKIKQIKKMYVRIIDQGECLSTTREYIDGVYANKNEWAKHNFYPKNGMVGELVKKTPLAYIVKIMDGIYVPMTKKGIEEISLKDYEAGVNNNRCNGMNERQKRINDGWDTFGVQSGNDWFHLPDMREAFKQDVVRNIEKLSCDYKCDIFLADLEKSAIMYAVDMCLEYRRKSGTALAPVVIDDIASQVCDVYMELFKGQFRQINKNNCMHTISALVNTLNVREVVDNYYRKINERYNRT